MSKYDIGIRKYTEHSTVRYWLMINAKISDAVDQNFNKLVEQKSLLSPRNFVNNRYWVTFIKLIIIAEFIIIINSAPYTVNNYFLPLVILMYLLRLCYLIDIIMATSQKIAAKVQKKKVDTKKCILILIDIISIFPFEIIYFILSDDPDYTTFWTICFIAFLRTYVIVQFVLIKRSVARSYSIKIVLFYCLFIAFLIDGYACSYIPRIIEISNIVDRNSSNLNIFIDAIYFSTVTILNIGFGDITPKTELEMTGACICMILGFVTLTGIITGTLASTFANKEKARENYRSGYEFTINVLKNHKVDKRVIEKISDNLQTFWNLKIGFTSANMNFILPVSLQKEIYFDINFGFLNRSLLFSVQSRSFLRSVSMLMKNISLLPGDILTEQFAINEAMIGIATGVLEILSQENDDAPLVSFTTGTILGEASLFITIPFKCLVRASTIVELQVLKKKDFIRLALKYPEIYRSMREDILYRINFIHKTDKKLHESVDADIVNLIKKKSIKQFQSELKNPNKRELDKEDTSVHSLKTNLLNLYVLSDNIPRVKVLPITLLKAKPWILRPNTTLLNLWDLLIVFTVIVVSFVYPYLAGFVRRITREIYAFVVIIYSIYITDLIIQCITAIESNDYFTYRTSIKDIIFYKLKTLGFYLDILATFDLTIYSHYVMPNDPNHAYFLLSLNRLLKFWRIVQYFQKLEDTMSTNILILRTCKYIFYYAIAVFWSGAILYLEACPNEVCVNDRWFAQLEVNEVKNNVSSTSTEWPAMVTIYWGSVIVAGVGYGDIVAKAIIDCVAVLFCIVIGTIFVVYYGAQASATIKHLQRNRKVYQEEILATTRFMTDHHISKELQIRVKNFFRMQWTYDKGLTFKQHQFLEGLPGLQKEVILTEKMKKFFTVPVFRTTSTSFLRLLAKSSKVRVLPPNEILTHGGIFVREMYILENGFCEVSAAPNLKIVIGPVTPIGYIEMILGRPLNMNVLTLTHARIISLDYPTYLRAVTKYSNVKIEIDLVIEKLLQLSNEQNIETLGFRLLMEKAIPQEEVEKVSLSKECINTYRYSKKLSISYWEGFSGWGKCRFFQFLLLPIVISPHGVILKSWAIFRIICVLLIGIVAPIYFSLLYQAQILSYLVHTLLALSWVDIYIMFHVGYYDDRGLLMFHPAKTATRYLKGTFLLDFITSFPYHWFIQTLFPRKSNAPSLFHDAPGFIMVIQFYKFYQACNFWEGDIMQPFSWINVLKFLPLSVVVTNVISGFIILIECKLVSPEPSPNNPPYNLKSEYEMSIEEFCKASSSQVENEYNLNPFKFYLTTYYWIITTMTTVGFGDITPNNKILMLAISIIIFLGLFLYGYMFAKMTSDMISADSSITKYRRRVREMLIFMKKMNADKDIQTRLIQHFQYNWQRREGANPQKLLAFIHAVLRDSIVASMYEETIRQVPAFLNMENIVIKVIGKYLDEIYFLRGETIMKYNDVQEYIYLIYRGKVDVLAKDGAFITTMGSGGLFGNIANKQFPLSSVTVVTRTNVDMLKLDSQIFFKSLEMYPDTKVLVKYLISRKDDYIVPLELDSGESQSNIKPDQTETIPYEATRSIRSSSINQEPSMLSDAKNFHFKKAIFKRPTRHRISSVVFLHDSWLHTFIETSIFLLTYISTSLTFYMFSFQNLSPIFLILSYSMDFVYYCKLCFQFNLSHYDIYGNYVINKRKIVKRYLRERTNMTFDILANFPFDLLIFIPYVTDKLTILSVLRLNRMLRLYYVHCFYELKRRAMMTNRSVLKIWWIILNSALVIHLFACFWYFITCPLGNNIKPSWVTEMNLENATEVRLYVESIYYIVTLTTTTGYGDIKLRSSIEIVTATILMTVCRFGVVLLSGSMAAVTDSHGTHLFIYQEAISNIKTNLRTQKTSGYQIEKMWHYVISLWSLGPERQIPKLIHKAPYVMKCEVMDSMYGHHLSQSYIFSQSDETFLKQLASYLQRSIFFQGNYIIQQGDIDYTMYFINKGIVSVLTINPDLTETIHFKLQENDNFGMKQGLVIGTQHHFSYRAETQVEILFLTFDHWQHLLKYFPEIKTNIYKRLNSLPILNDSLTQDFSAYLE